MKQNVRKGEELAEIPLKTFLLEKKLIQDANSELEVEQFKNGYSNLTYLLRIENKELVLRRPPFGAIKRGHDMGREYKVLSGLDTAFSKAPKAYAFSDGDVLGAPFYIMEKVKGIILTAREANKRAIPAKDFKQISESWLDTFVELHQLDFEGAGLSDLGRPDGYVERQVFNWGKQYIKAATLEIPEALKVMEWMAANLPKQYDFSLIHNDYKYDNVVFKDDQWQEVQALLDWEMCTLGDPLMDLGTSVAYWIMPDDNDALKLIMPSPTLMDGNPSRSELVELYAQKSGRKVDQIVFYYVYGLFKIAVIAQQIFYRYNKGLTTDERFAHLDKVAELLCKMAWQAVQSKQIEHLGL